MVLKDTLIAQIYKFYSNSNKKEVIFTLQGDSMYPTLKAGWKVKVKPTDAKEINCGDIIIFSQKELICHRIIGRFRLNKKYYFIHQGDNQPIGGVLQENNLIGKVIEAYDTEGRRIDEKNWQRPPSSFMTLRLLGYIYLPFFFIKRAIFKKSQNKPIRWIRKQFWNTYNITLKKL